MTEQVEQKEYPYEIKENELNTVYPHVISSFGGKKFSEGDDEDKVINIINVLMKGGNVGGCKYFEKSLKEDKTFDENTSTVMLSSFVNLKYLGFGHTTYPSKKVLLSRQMRDKLNVYFTTVGSKFNMTSDGPKILMIKNIDDKNAPDFVKRANKRDFVYVKVIMKLSKI